MRPCPVRPGLPIMSKTNAKAAGSCPLKTTCIGAYPKPAYVPISDWFATGHDQDGYASDVQRRWEDNQTNEARALMDRATAEVVRDQIACGIDIPTDGEVRRENYIHYTSGI